MKENKCPYCNKTLAYDKDYCDKQCKDNYVKFISYTQKWSKVFIGTTY